MYLKILTFLGLTFLLGNVNPSRGSTAVSKNTNAWRLSHGLPPLPPRFAVRSKGATAPSATTAKPSHTPHHHLSTRIQVFAGNGSSLGYVNSMSISGVHSGANSGQHLRVRKVSGSEAFVMIGTNPSIPAVSSSKTLNSLDLRDLVKVSFSNVVHPVNPNYGAASGKDFVTWSLNPSTKELQAQYVKLDGSKSRLFLALDADENELYFVRTTDSSQMINLYLCED